MGYGKILVAYDGSSHSEQAFDAAVELVDHGLAERAIVFEVTSLFYEASFISEAGGMEALMRTMDTADEKEAALAEQISKLPGYSEDKVVIKAGFGNPRDEILRVAEEESCGLIAMGSRGLGAVRGILGSVSYGVLVHADVPVLIMK